MTAKPPGAKGLMGEGFRDSCVWGRCLLTAYSACNNKLSKSFFQKPSERVGQLKSQKTELAAQLCKGVMEERETRGSVQSCSWQNRSHMEKESDLNKAQLIKLPFWKCKVLTSCTMHFVVSLFSLETCWE